MPSFDMMSPTFLLSTRPMAPQQNLQFVHPALHPIPHPQMGHYINHAPESVPFKCPNCNYNFSMSQKINPLLQERDPGICDNTWRPNEYEDIRQEKATRSLEGAVNDVIPVPDITCAREGVDASGTRQSDKSDDGLTIHTTDNKNNQAITVETEPEQQKEKTSFTRRKSHGKKTPARDKKIPSNGKRSARRATFPGCEARKGKVGKKSVGRFANSLTKSVQDTLSPHPESQPVRTSENGNIITKIDTRKVKDDVRTVITHYRKTGGSIDRLANGDNVDVSSNRVATVDRGPRERTCEQPIVSRLFFLYNLSLFTLVVGHSDCQCTGCVNCLRDF